MILPGSSSGILWQVANIWWAQWKPYSKALPRQHCINSSTGLCCTWPCERQLLEKAAGRKYDWWDPIAKKEREHL